MPSRKKAPPRMGAAPVQVSLLAAEPEPDPVIPPHVAVYLAANPLAWLRIGNGFESVTRCGFFRLRRTGSAWALDYRAHPADDPTWETYTEASRQSYLKDLAADLRRQHGWHCAVKPAATA